MSSDRVKVRPETAEEERVAELQREVARLKAEVEDLRSRAIEAERLADTDVLLPVLNRRALMRELARTLAFCKRYGTTASLLYLDLDGFKGVNDRFGHAVGDEALKRVADLLVALVRESDAVARLGGDEFAIILQQADPTQAAAKAKQLAERLTAERFVIDGEIVPLAGSFGVRGFDAQDSADQWLAEADAAMFVRKQDRPR
jgi:diguanylate cyclase (GGDEF)-like protein